MRLRELKIKDAERMFEWMQDPSIVGQLKTDFLSKTITDCRNFIIQGVDNKNLHLAITDDDDIYMGTVSLKNITSESAEFAIVLHKDAMGKGYSLQAMKAIFAKGFQLYKLDYIYWCVDKENMRAIRFYDKNGFSRVNISNYNISEEYNHKQKCEYIWYCETKKQAKG